MRHRPTATHPPTNGRAADLLKVIRASGKRLTVQRLLEELRAREDLGVQAWSETKVSNTATAMVQLGFLTSSKVTDPPGYGLPEWGDGLGPLAGQGPMTPAPTRAQARNGTTHVDRRDHAERNGDVDELAGRAARGEGLFEK